jgi:surface protein
MGDFISIWLVPVAETQIILPILRGFAAFDIRVEWGDGAADEYFNTDFGEIVIDEDRYPSHTYTFPGDKTIRVTRLLPGWSFVGGLGTPSLLKSIIQYGGLELANTGSQFLNCTNLESFPQIGPLLQLPISCDGMFKGCVKLNTNLNNTLRTTGVQIMSNMFSGCSRFNGNISNWDVQLVSDMRSMFFGCTDFDGNLSAWNVQRVENMSAMFGNCVNFTGDNIFTLGQGNVLTLMNSMFRNTNFNGNISNWDVRNVTNMSNIFTDCTSFRRDISKWVTTAITANVRAPTFTTEYIDEVNPKFSSKYPESWKFTASDEVNSVVNKDIIDTILPANRKDRYYMDDDLRLRTLFEQDEAPSASAITGSGNSSIKYAYNSRINIFF